MKDLTNLEVGDIVVNGEYKKTVLAVLPNGIYLFSTIDVPNEANVWWTAETMQELGWKLKQKEEKTYTLSEIIRVYSEWKNSGIARSFIEYFKENHD